MPTNILEIKKITFSKDMTKSKILLDLFLNNELGEINTNNQVDNNGFMSFYCRNSEFSKIFNKKNIPDPNFRETVCYLGEIIVKNNLNVFEEALLNIAPNKYLEFMQHEYDYLFGYSYNKSLKKMTFTFHVSLITKSITNNIKFNIYNKDNNEPTK